MRFRELLTEHLMVVDSLAFRQWFSQSKVVDGQGNPLPVYHGTGRPDRVGTRFRKARATAGPMAYFTDDPEIASNYAQAKADTSIGDEETNYPNWFKVQTGRTWSGIDRLWYFLPHEEKQEIATLAPKVTREEVFHDDGDDQRYASGYRYSLDGNNGLGAYDQHLRQARGNVLMALVDEWLLSGALHGDEEEFLKVLKLTGLKHPVKYDHPQASYPFVYQVFLSIQRPLVTTAIPQPVVDAFAKKVSRTRHQPKSWATQWDKDTVDPREWLRGLLNDVENQTEFTWTVIPDWVTAILKGFGYDGIQDVGGKYHDGKHAVWIPFDEHQVKSAISNKRFRSDKSNIHQ